MKNNILSINEYRNNPEFYFTKGLRLANKKNLSEAYKNLLKALELEPDNSEYKFSMACFLSEFHRPLEANRIFNDLLINFDPKMFDCFFGLGCNSFEEGNNEKAAEYFDQYLYYDPDGEFSYEISEMAFYLRLYSEVSHDNKFLKISEYNYKKALKYLSESSLEKAIGCLYKAIQSNPLNIEARNYLTLALIQKQQYIRAEYINSTVKDLESDNVWGNCLKIFLLSNSKKKTALKKSLEFLPYRTINCREELLCVATTLFFFEKIEELVSLLENYIVEYSDQFIYSALMLSYIITKNKSKAQKLTAVLETYLMTNPNLRHWMSYVKNSENYSQILETSFDQYAQIFSITGEPYILKYHPSSYGELNVKRVAPRLPKKYTPIIEGSIRNREIMYSRLYEKEIIGILSNSVQSLTEPICLKDKGYDMYSAALEYSYCRLFNIQMKKAEIVDKYKISTEKLNTALRILNFSL